MSRRDRQRVEDIAGAIAAIREHTARGDVSDGLVLDAVRMRLIEIGEAAKAISEDARGLAPGIPWSLVAKMRDRLAHRYFETEVELVRATVDRDLPELLEAIEQLRGLLPEE